VTTIRAEAQGEGLLLSVVLPKPLPRALEGHAGFNLEFLPSAYFEKAYLADGRSGIFPLHPGAPMAVTGPGTREPKPIAAGKTLVLAPPTWTTRAGPHPATCTSTCMRKGPRRTRRMRPAITSRA
jgi:hypothetical protein